MREINLRVSVLKTTTASLTFTGKTKRPSKVTASSKTEALMRVIII